MPETRYDYLFDFGGVSWRPFGSHLLKPWVLKWFLVATFPPSFPLSPPWSPWRDRGALPCLPQSEGLKPRGRLIFPPWHCSLAAVTERRIHWVVQNPTNSNELWSLLNNSLVKFFGMTFSCWSRAMQETVETGERENPSVTFALLTVSFISSRSAVKGRILDGGPESWLPVYQGDTCGQRWIWAK